MTSVNLEKSLEYLKIEESLRFENFIEYYLCEGIFLYVFLFMIICLKCISGEFFVQR